MQYIQQKNDRIILNTKNTTYVIRLFNGEFLNHLYYGEKTDHSNVPDQKLKYYGFVSCPQGYEKDISLDMMSQEYSFFGTGDYRADALRIKNANGDNATAFRYKSHKTFKGRKKLESLPYAEAENAETLLIELLDKTTDCTLELYYTVFYDYDVISRSVVIKNNSNKPVEIEKCMSFSLDLNGHDYDLSYLHGKHCYEFQYEREPISYGVKRLCSRRGASSHQMNPFFALYNKDTTEDRGGAYGFNFVFSGSYLNEIEVDQFGNTRIQVGLGDENFCWLLKGGETFVSPEAVMGYSKDGIGGLSRLYHNFVNDCIVGRERASQVRPVVLNTWEACYFNIDEEKIYRFAEKAVDLGMDMIVVDDGWFSTRNDETSGLGDWTVNKDKFKNGLRAFSERIRALGLKFGIWIEPEMVNPNSELFKNHPEWCVQCKDRVMSLHRYQYSLDMSNHEVVAYLKKSFEEVFDGVEIDYIKWDMNRHLTEVGSPYLPKERQKETAYRYVLGVYDLFAWFNQRYPHIILESCGGGGGRFDLGALKYSSQIWTSDNTSPKPRCRIQYGATRGYPTSTTSCHVSNSDKPIKDAKNLEYKYNVALNGVLGYEFNVLDLTDAGCDEVRKQVAEYKRYYADLILNGDFFVDISPYASDYYAFHFTSKDKKRILIVFANVKNTTEKERTVRIKDLPFSVKYHDPFTGKEYASDELINNGLTFVGTEQEYYSKRLYLEVK